jgi:hypothetical protein
MGAVCFAYERGALLQSLNSYSYANDNPVSLTDRQGLPLSAERVRQLRRLPWA